jgi:hypothetical protein
MNKERLYVDYLPQVPNAATLTFEALAGQRPAWTSEKTRYGYPAISITFALIRAGASNMAASKTLDTGGGTSAAAAIVSTGPSRSS